MSGFTRAPRGDRRGASGLSFKCGTEPTPAARVTYAEAFCASVPAHFVDARSRKKRFRAGRKKKAGFSARFYSLITRSMLQLLVKLDYYYFYFFSQDALATHFKSDNLLLIKRKAHNKHRLTSFFFLSRLQVPQFVRIPRATLGHLQRARLAVELRLAHLHDALISAARCP